MQRLLTGPRSRLLGVLAAPVLVLTTPGVAHAAAGSAQAHAAAPTCARGAPFDAHDFPARPRVDNRWYPLRPGTQYILEGRANRGGGVLPHQVILTVTDLTKVVNGVRSVVLWDRDINEGVLSEAELAFHAQDKDGDVFVLGEYPEEYEDGKFIGAPSTWISGVGGAKAGILVPGKPRVGQVFGEGYAPQVGFYDCGKVLSTNLTFTANGKRYTGGLLVDEWAPLEPENGHQRKFYAPGVGNVQITAVDDPEGETLVLTKVVQLSPSALKAARAAALKLEKRAYQISAAYRRTPPAC